jgi:hypothetical protein
MMENYAEDAVQRSGEFGATLDYSEGSLRTLETILGQISATLPKSDSQKTEVTDSAQEQIDAASRIWGGYFGETIRRLWGGDWGVETYPGTVAPVVSIDIGGAKLFPVMKVYRRLTEGEDENVWEFYQMVRERVASAGNQQ